MKEPRTRIICSVAYAYNVAVVCTSIDNISYHWEGVLRQVALAGALNNPKVVLNALSVRQVSGLIC
jgi:hypothetical protein